MKIKQYHTEIETKKGDYILFNGAVYQFCTGDNRKLGYENYSSYHTIVLTKKALKEIPLDTMKKIVRGNKEDKTLLIYWIFE
jgi:hypothetical protein